MVSFSHGRCKSLKSLCPLLSPSDEDMAQKYRSSENRAKKKRSESGVLTSAEGGQISEEFRSAMVCRLARHPVGGVEIAVCRPRKAERRCRTPQLVASAQSVN